MTEAASVFISLVPTARGFGRGIRRAVGPDVDTAGREGGRRYGAGMSAGLKGAGAKIFAPLAAAGAALGVAGFLKDAIAEARESQKVGALTTQVIKTTGSAAKITATQVGALAAAISNKTGIDDEAIQSASNLLLTFTNVRNEVGRGNDVFNQATQAATDMGAALGKDPKDAAIQLGKALNDPIKGVTALSRVGVSFTEQQKLQIKTLVDSGNTLGAQKIVLGELRKEFGGAAAASATGGEKLAVAFGNFKEQIGTALLPVIDKVAGVLTTKIIPAVSGFIKGMQDGTGAGGRFRDALRPVGTFLSTLVTAFKAFFTALKDGDVTSDGLVGAFETVGDFLHRRLPPAIATAKTAFDAVFSFVRDTAIPVLARIASGVGNLIGFFVRHRAVILPLVAVYGGMIVAYKAFILVMRVVAFATRAYAAVQAALNVVMTLNPIGLVIALIAGLVIGLIVAYKKSDTFRAIVNAAFKGVAAVWKWLWNTILKPQLALLVAALGALGTAAKFLYEKVMKPVFRFIANQFLDLVGAILTGAAKAFGWVPGLGPKLKTAAAKFATFREGVNKQLNGINDKTINVFIKHNTATGEITEHTRRVHRRAGGSVFGAGTETSDSIPAMLSHNEHVWSAQEVRGAGGHSNLERMRKLARSGALPGFKAGGRVIDITATDRGMPAAYKAVAAAMNAAAAQAALGGLDGTGGLARGNGVGSRASLLAFAALITRMGYDVSEGPDPYGPVHRVHARNSRHYLGRAIDVNHGTGTSRAEQAALAKIIGLGHSYGLSSIFMAPGHYNHAHFQYDKGGWLAPGRTMVENKTGKPEAVFNQEQLAALTARRGGGVHVAAIYGFTPQSIIRDLNEHVRRQDALHPTYG